ncbi:MAG: hypothetical protein OMM_04038 [Candidatus Magnetoglobus multicellularis str. Araruama]|uniref:Lipoprotein n=1 Tax=Candidatus Magnetoglobus multicellularis str. Araruama TaxID=890399 RepID=A0A1V1P390_9BACT|nr:MAG: hypothetical protein OMM_04038 [Candidatus Magnetoglobus multicellularis str. Araruama]
MQKSIILLISILLTVSCCQNAQSRNPKNTHIIVGISPFQPKSAILKQKNQFGDALKIVMNIVTNKMDSGDKLSLIDTDNLREIACFHYPSNIKLTSKLKTKYIAKPLKETFIYYKDKEPENQSGNLNIPKFMKLLKDRIAIIDNKNIEVVFIGSPIHKSKNPKFNFDHGWLSDAAFYQDTPFRATGDNSFRRIKFHMIFVGFRFVNLKHQEGLERFWSLYFKMNEAELITFNPDIKAYERIKEDIQSKFFQIDPKDIKYLTLHLPERQPTIKKKRHRPKKRNSMISSLEIITTWETKSGKSADIDLHLLLKSQKAIVNFQNRKFERGNQKAQFYKALSKSSSVKNGFENILLNNFNINDLDLWLNSYSRYPRKVKVKGKVSINFDNEATPYLIPFEISRQSNGTDFKDRHKSKAWTNINIYQFFQVASGGNAYDDR